MPAPVERELQEYLTENGKSPFGEWLEKLRDRKARGVIRSRLNRVRLGNFGNCEPVGEGVFEFKIDFGPGYRVYFGLDGNRIIVLLCGGDKSSQKDESSRQGDPGLNTNV